jgi:hypothetical protein
VRAIRGVIVRFVESALFADPRVVIILLVLKYKIVLVAPTALPTMACVAGVELERTDRVPQRR